MSPPSIGPIRSVWVTLYRWPVSDVPDAGPTHTPRMNASRAMPFASAGVGGTGATAGADGGAAGLGPVVVTGADAPHAATTNNEATVRMASPWTCAIPRSDRARRPAPVRRGGGADRRTVDSGG